MFVEECYKEKDTPTSSMAEIYEHILFHGVKDWDFGKGGIDYVPKEELVLVDWGLLRKFTQLEKGEEAEEAENTIEDQKRAMICCIEFMKYTYNTDFGLPDPEDLPWESISE